jgi:putative addiction module killer protein
VSEISILEYQTASGKSPYRQWLKKMDAAVRARIQLRINRFQQGNFGDSKKVTKDVWEARIHFGPGYRVYYAKVEDKILLLLCAGDKSSQSKDIEKASNYLEDYRSEHG